MSPRCKSPVGAQRPQLPPAVWGWGKQSTGWPVRRPSAFYLYTGFELLSAAERLTAPKGDANPARPPHSNNIPRKVILLSSNHRTLLMKPLCCAGAAVAIAGAQPDRVGGRRGWGGHGEAAALHRRHRHRRRYLRAATSPTPGSVRSAGSAPRQR